MPPKRTGRVPATLIPPVDAEPPANSSNPTPDCSQPTLSRTGSEDDEARSAEEARLIQELARINREERISILCRQINKARAKKPVASGGTASSRASSSQPDYRGTVRTQSEAGLELPSPKRQEQRPPRTKQPPEYRGRSRAEYTDFLRACDFNFDASPCDFQTDKQKVMFAVQYLKGPPLDDWRCYKTKHGLEDIQWIEFIAVLKDALGDPENRNQFTYGAYFSATQQPSQMVWDFVKHLEVLGEDLDDSPEEFRFQRLLSGLRKEIRDITAASPTTPKGRHALIAQASHIEESLRKGALHTEQRQATAAPRNATSNLPRLIANAPQTRTRRRAEEKERKEKQRKEGLCYKCGEPGHIAIRCPTQKAPVANSNPYPPPSRSECPRKENIQ